MKLFFSIGISEKRNFCHSLEEGNPGFKAKNKLDFTNTYASAHSYYRSDIRAIAEYVIRGRFIK